MKKQILLLPLAILAMVSCSNDEQIPLEKKVVMVRPLVQYNTRGESVTLANLGTFRVYGVNDDPANPAIEENFTDLVSPLDDGSTWGMQRVHYWMVDPVSKSPSYGANVAHFTGIYPSSLTTSATLPASIGLSLNTANGRALDDILVAYSGATRNDNLVSGVPLNFKHVLSQIVIRAANGHIDERKIEVIGIKLSNVKPEGTLTLPTSDTTPNAAYDPIGNPAGTPQSYVIKHVNGEIVTLTEDVQTIMFDGEYPGGFMVIPQSFTCNEVQANLQASDTYLSVLCRIYKKNSADDWSLIYPKNGDDGKYAFASVGISGTWEPGKKYIYTLNFYEDNGGAGTIDPDPVNPDDPDDPEVDTNPDYEDDPTGVVDDEQAKTPITFTVTVEDWLDGSGSDSDFNKIM
ncbi:MAG: fimbrillin family protein [Prevotella sp.]|nr:fimbrillin family protein [Prevotella sp.]